MKPRKLFQLHLSTALVLMVLAGALVWLNVRKVLTEEHEELKNNISPLAVLARGWPWTFQNYWGPVFGQFRTVIISANQGTWKVGT